MADMPTTFPLARGCDPPGYLGAGCGLKRVLLLVDNPTSSVRPRDWPISLVAPLLQLDGTKYVDESQRRARRVGRISSSPLNSMYVAGSGTNGEHSHH